MYKIKDNIFENRWVTMGDGYVVKFANQFAYVPDGYVEYFKRISDFDVQTHTPEVTQAEEDFAAQFGARVKSVTSEEKENEENSEKEIITKPKIVVKQKEEKM